MGCGSVKSAFAKVVDPLGVFEKPDTPRVKKPPKVDEAEDRRRAELIKRVRKQRSIAAFGLSDTALTGPGGLGKTAGTGKRPSLLGT